MSIWVNTTIRSEEYYLFGVGDYVSYGGRVMLVVGRDLLWEKGLGKDGHTVIYKISHVIHPNPSLSRDSIEVWFKECCLEPSSRQEFEKQHIELSKHGIRWREK